MTTDEAHLALRRETYQFHKDEWNQRRRELRVQTPKYRETEKAWRERNREKIRAQRKANRSNAAARKQGNGTQWTAAENVAMGFVG